MPKQMLNAFILIAPDFDEKFVVACVSRFQEAGMAVEIIGLSAGANRGLHGIRLLPDRSLKQSKFPDIGQQERPLLVIAGGRECETKLLLDPRIHAWIEWVLAKDGFIVLSEQARMLLNRMGWPELAATNSFSPEEIVKDGTLFFV